MTTTASAVIRGLFKKELACTRCGGDNVFPAPGPFGALATVIGLERHFCRPCSRPFWARTSAEYSHSEKPEPEDLAELLAAPAEAPDDEASVDLDMSGPEPEPVDLAALDAEFERRCAVAKGPPRHGSAVAKT